MLIYKNHFITHSSTLFEITRSTKKTTEASLTDPEMAKNDMSNEVAKAWAEFTKDTEKAKEDILSVFNEDSGKEEQNWTFFFIMGLMVLLVAFPIYKLVSSLVKKNK